MTIGFPKGDISLLEIAVWGFAQIQPKKIAKRYCGEVWWSGSVLMVTSPQSIQVLSQKNFWWPSTHLGGAKSLTAQSKELGGRRSLSIGCGDIQCFVYPSSVVSGLNRWDVQKHWKQVLWHGESKGFPQKPSHSTKTHPIRIFRSDHGKSVSWGEMFVGSDAFYLFWSSTSGKHEFRVFGSDLNGDSWFWYRAISTTMPPLAPGGFDFSLSKVMVGPPKLFLS